MPETFVADLHVHSKYSRATSRQADLVGLARWAKLKGVRVVATGDFTHPAWFETLREQLVADAEGLYRLRPELEEEANRDLPQACRTPVSFVLEVESSNIYKRAGKVRKVHNLVYVPDLDAADRFRQALARVGNIASDGRPILGLDSRDLLEMVLETDPLAFLVPAHVWTPWFSVLGSKGGFDSLEDCFADLLPHVFALETGLSSDPPMNWRLSALDRYVLVSNSDAHSPARLAREANLFACEVSYPAMLEALRTGEGFLGTVEFYPEEGKYHLDGHRKCGVRLTPKQTREFGGRCPVCGKPVTVGVMHRVEELADRPEGARPEGAKDFVSLVGLESVLAEAMGKKNSNTKTVQARYRELLDRFGAELEILRNVPLEDISRAAGSLVAEAVRRVRAGRLHVLPGFDGEYGRVQIFTDEERSRLVGQGRLFAVAETGPEWAQGTGPGALEPGAARQEGATPRPDTGLPDGGARESRRAVEGQVPLSAEDPVERVCVGLTAEQRAAVLAPPGRVVIVAGPGTGKTRVLTARVAVQVARGQDPERIAAVTFTNKAAEQLSERLEQLVGRAAARVRARTFHRLCLELMEAQPERFGLVGPVRILDRASASALRRLLRPDWPERKWERVLRWVAWNKAGRQGHPPGAHGEDIVAAAADYQAYLDENGLLDLDDLVSRPVLRASQDEALREYLEGLFDALFVDEYQDVSPRQEQLVELLGAQGHVTIIGDPDQAIYGFRGADPRAMERFVARHEDATVFRLSESFRTPDLVLQAAGRVVGGGPGPGGLRSRVRYEGEALPVAVLPTERAEAEFVVAELEGLLGGIRFFSLDSGRAESHTVNRDIGFGDVAVLFRTRHQVEPLVEAFARSGIPFEVVAGTVPWSDEARLVLSILRVATDTARDLWRAVARDALESLGRGGGAPDAVLDGLVPLVDPDRAEAAVVRVAEALWSDEPDTARRVFGELEPVLGGTVAHALALASVGRTQDAWRPGTDRVHLMTIHAAKGLEFPVVFLVGLNEGVLPSRGGDLEEERRLFYVALTRASRHVFLSACRTRDSRPAGAVSRFVSELEGLVRHRDRGGKKRRPRQLELF